MLDIKYLKTEDNRFILTEDGYRIILDNNSITKRITIINKWFNTTTKKNEYRLNTIIGFYESAKSINIQDTSLINSDEFFCAIPMSTYGYQTPDAFQTNPTGWTLQKDDYIVKGKITTITSINDVLENNECMKITKVAVCDFGSPNMQHYEVWGK